MQHIIKKSIQDIGQHPFLFVGSGFSRRYFNTPNFEDLLRHFSKQVSNDEFLFPSYLQKSERHMPTVASLLENDFNHEFYKQGSSDYLKEKFKNELQNGLSPFKIAIADYFASFSILEPKYSHEVELIQKLAIRNINGVITTNYDFLVEGLFKDFKPYIGQNELLFSTLNGVAEIYKIHGCSSSPESIVITQKDYDEFNKKSQYLVSKLLTIFLEYPIFFIGYSLNDENIQLIFKNIKQCLTSEKLSVLQNRLFFIKRSNNAKDEISTSIFEGIPFTQITTNDYSKVYEGILSAKSNYNPRLISKLKRDVYSLVKTQKSQDVVGVIDIENIDDIEKINSVIIGVGNNQNFVSILDAENIYEYAVLNDYHVNVNDILTIHLPKILRRNVGELPIFKLLSKTTIPYEKFDTRIKNYVEAHKSLDSFLNKSQIEHKKKFEAKPLQELIQDFGDEAYLKIVFLDESHINVEELETYLIRMVNNGKLKELRKAHNPYVSILKKVIRIYDYLKYKK